MVFVLVSFSIAMLRVCVFQRSQRDIVGESARADATNEKFAHYTASK